MIDLASQAEYNSKYISIKIRGNSRNYYVKY